MQRRQRRTALIAFAAITLVVVAVAAQKQRLRRVQPEGRTVETQWHAPPARSSSIQQPNSKLFATLRYGAPIHYRNLTLIPIGTTRPAPYTKYTVLEKGLAAKTLAVRELDGRADSAAVSEVEVRNSGKHAAYLLGGEMILGGKQDRIVAHDVVVPQDGRWTRVPVFCVEQGRWAGQVVEFAGGKALAHSRLRREAMNGGQQAVWDEVARKHRERGTASNTGTYRRTIQNRRVRARIAPHRKKLAALLPRDLALIGAVFAINGKIEVGDLMINPLLFSDLRTKLLSAYLLEAVGHPVKADAPRVTVADARAFFARAKAQRPVKAMRSGRSTTYRRRSGWGIGDWTIDRKTGQGALIYTLF